jgi:hypothetical protein
MHSSNGRNIAAVVGTGVKRYRAEGKFETETDETRRYNDDLAEERSSKRR